LSKKKCANCSNIVSIFYTHEDGLNYCESCYNKLFATCAGCKAVKYKSDMTRSPIDYYTNKSYFVEWFCDECFDDIFFRCEFCGEYDFREYECLSPDEEIICERCFEDNCVRCCNCDKILWADSAERFEGEPYCFDCFSECFFVCCGCGESYDLDDYVEDGLCLYCFREEDLSVCNECGRRFRDNYLIDNLCMDCYIKINPPRVTEDDIKNAVRLVNLCII